MASHRHAPVPYTCGTINEVRNFINELEQYFEYFPDAEHVYLSKLMGDNTTKLEEIRYHNAELREWGCQLYEDKVELEEEKETLEKDIKKIRLELAKEIVEVSEFEEENETLSSRLQSALDVNKDLYKIIEDLKNQIIKLEYEVNKDKPF